MSISSKGITSMTGIEISKSFYDKRSFSISLKNLFPLNPLKKLTKEHLILERNTSMMISKQFV